MDVKCVVVLLGQLQPAVVPQTIGYTGATAH